MNKAELRELDAWIAEHVMGWKDITLFVSEGLGQKYYVGAPPEELLVTGNFYRIEPIPEYSTDIAVAWEVVEKIGKDHGFSLGGWFAEGGEYYIEWLGRFDGIVVADTAPLAICLAAKKWKEESEEEDE